jgi:LytS/YehU family sensor histidine kinase
MSTEVLLMDDRKDEVVKQKEFLAQEALKVANEAIGLLQDQMSECSTRDLVQIFTASVKAHREITEDIVLLTAKETPSEESLAKEYDGKVEELLKRISNF